MPRKSQYTFSLFVTILVSLNVLLSACGGEAASTPAPPVTPAPLVIEDFVPKGSSTPTSAATTAAFPTTAVPVATTARTIATAAIIQEGVPRFEPSGCPFRLAKEQEEGKDVRCGYLVVPEEHAKPTGPLLRLAVAILPAIAPNASQEPVVVLQGGPGGPIEDFVQAFSREKFPARTLQANRDVIFLDQRGVGYSQPILDCREYNELVYNDLSRNLSTADNNQRSQVALDACRNRLVAQGVNLAAYNTAENAADVNALHLALGYKKLNLYGVSYGTRLVLTVMRDFPEGVKSAILDASYPLQADIMAETPVSYDRALNGIFKACAADAACNKAFPDLKGIFARAVAKLNAQPAIVKTQHPKTFRLYDVTVNGKDLVRLMFGLLYSSQVIPYIPAIIYFIEQGEYQLLGNAMSGVVFDADDSSEGMYYSVQCGDEASFSNYNAALAAGKNLLPEIRDNFVPTQQGMFNICRNWPARKAPRIENEPVKSDIPTLVTVGEFDPITPPNLGQIVSSTLSKSYYMEFPGLGHGVVPDSLCAATIAQNFLIDPTTRPASDCISKAGVRFVTPGR